MKKVASHLQYDWWKYAAVILVPLILWCSVFSALKKPKANERLHVLVLGEGLDIAAMERELTDYLEANLEQPLKSVKVAMAEYTQDMFENQMMAATYAYDILLISREQMRQDIGRSYFFVLPQQLQTDGISLYEETVDGEQRPFGAYVLEQYVAFISPQTKNLYPLHPASEAGDQAAVLAWQWLMVYGN